MTTNAIGDKRVVYLYQLCYYGDTDFIIQTSTNQKPALLSARNALKKAVCCQGLKESSKLQSEQWKLL